MRAKKVKYASLILTGMFVLVLIGFFLGRAYSETAIYMQAPEQDDADETVRSGITVIHAPEQDAADDPQPSGSETEQEQVNINTADSQQLQQLNGIGPALAERIIAYRNENGPFQSIEQIQNVSGIGPKKFEKIQSSIKVG